jgi:subtilisin family serine protease
MKKLASSLVIALLGTALVTAATASTQPAAHRYVVLADSDASVSELRSALRSLGARILRHNRAIGLATVVARGNFVTRAMESSAVSGVSRDRSIGRTPQTLQQRDVPFVTRRAGSATSLKRSHLGEDPLFRYQWTLRQISAGPSDSYELSTGDPDVMVGIIDSGIASAHPDIGPNFNQELSRNFTRDIPSIDGRCRAEKDNSCDDAPNIDEGGHGTWVASTVAGARNRRGISGIAPDVTLVNLRAGQDSVYVFLQPVVDALTYAGDIGVDVANMSFYIDPWLYNCTDNPADSEAAQLEQQTVIEATQRALDYARDRGVTLISALGNEFSDLDNPTIDATSPDYPPGNEYEREVDNSCIQVPAESEGVISVAGTGPSGRKSWFSNYGLEETDVAAPGGDTFDPALPYPYNGALAAWSKIGLEELGLLNRKGKPLVPDVIRRCHKLDSGKRRCGYYVFFEGTSIASPMATGVAALIVSEFGSDDGNGGLTMDPAEVERRLLQSAVPHACPEGGVQEYPEVGKILEPFGITTEDLRAECVEGPAETNSFYGAGIVNARNALEADPGGGPPN